MYNDIYSKIATPLEFAQGLAMKHYKDKKPKKRKNKRDLITDNDKVQFIKDEYERRRIERLYFELQWQLNMAFIEGEQYQYISNITNDLVEYPKLLEYQEREAFNHISPIYVTRLAKLSRLNQTFIAKPSTSDTDDINNAYVTTKILEAWSNGEEMISLENQANAWLEATGSVIWKTIWNEDRGRKLSETINPETGGVDGFVHEGDVENVVCSPFEIFPDSSYNSDIKYCKNIIHARPVDVDFVYDKYGVDVLGETLSVFSSGLNAIQTVFTKNGGTDTKQKDNCVMLYEFYENPSKYHPNGTLWICCDNYDKLLYEGELPFINNEYNNRVLPFDMARCIERPGYFWGKSIIDNLIPIQRRYNAIKNRTAEYLNRVAVGVTVIDAQTAEYNNVEENGINPGDILYYNPIEGSQIPTYMQTPPLPNKFYEQENMELQNFTKISGVSEISRDSSAPTSVESGRALNILQEADETRIALTARQIQNCMKNVAVKTIYAYKQFANNDRILRITGSSDAIRLISWNKNSLTTEDIQVEGVARISETLAQKRNFVLEMISLGLFRDANGMLDTAKVLEMVEFGDTNTGIDTKRLERSMTNEENIKMSATGQLVPVEFYEDHDVAIETHKEYMLSNEFKVLDPRIQEVFKAHLAQHMQYIQQQMMMAQQQQQNGGNNE